MAMDPRQEASAAEAMPCHAMSMSQRQNMFLKEIQVPTIVTGKHCLILKQPVQCTVRSASIWPRSMPNPIQPTTTAPHLEL